MLIAMTIALVAFALVSLDLRAYWSARQHAQDVADSAAAAGAGETREILSAGRLRVAIDEPLAAAAGQTAFAAADGPARQMLLDSQSCAGAASVCDLGWTVDVTQEFESLTLRMFGGGTFSASATATAVPVPVRTD